MEAEESWRELTGRGHAKHTLVEGVDYDLIYGETAVKNKITVTIKAKEGGSFTGEVSKKVNNK